jgi:hypothetical protein
MPSVPTAPGFRLALAAHCDATGMPREEPRIGETVQLPEGLAEPIYPNSEASQMPWPRTAGPRPLRARARIADFAEARLPPLSHPDLRNRDVRRMERAIRKAGPAAFLGVLKGMGKDRKLTHPLTHIQRLSENHLWKQVFIADNA